MTSTEQKNQAGLAANFSPSSKAIVLPCRTRQRPTKPFSPNAFKLGCLGLLPVWHGIVVAGGAEFLDDASMTKPSLNRCFRPRFSGNPALHTPQEEQDQKRWQKLSLSESE